MYPIDPDFQKGKEIVYMTEQEPPNEWIEATDREYDRIADTYEKKIYGY